jgi:hypothetical protein
MDSRDSSPYLVIAALCILVLAVYWQAGGHDFVHYDDPMYVSENPSVSSGISWKGVAWAFTTFHASNWHPLTWLSHMADVELFGLSPGWHHRMNVFYHLLNTELLFLVLWKMTGGMWQSAFVAALFGVHPLHVESVAWVAERKDVLSAFFWILTMGAYLRYVRKPGTGRYLLVTACFALGLMCKPMVVTMPFVLLLLDWWPLGRMTPSASAGSPPWRISMPALSRMVWEKVPWAGLAAISSVITIMAQRESGSITMIEHLPFGMRVSNALVSYSTYLIHTAWPRSLAFFYPHPVTVHADIPSWQIVGSLLLIVGISFLALRQGRYRPYLAVGWLWYLGTLLPVIGLAQVGTQAMADRYTYIPLVGIFIAVAWGLPELLPRRGFRRLALGGTGGAMILVLGIAAWIQTGYWQNSITLCTHALEVTEKNWEAWTVLGLTYGKLGHTQQAIGYFREAIRIRPNYFDPWFNLGVLHEKLGQSQQAIEHYRVAVRINPGHAEAWNNLGSSYGRLGQTGQAMDHFRRAVQIRPDYAEAWYNLGVAYSILGQTRQAEESFREAGRITPPGGSP